MSPFLRAREEALKLRRELLGDQAESAVASQRLLANVESVLNLGVQQVPHTSSLLKGGKATLRRQDGFIYCRKEFEWPEQAYLIAHELGHFRLEPDMDEDAVHINSDGIFPSSQATAYVEAYGARERDELQKNVFGRELLLPRQVARDLFLAGQSPKAIAKSLGIPLEVARQQVLDAVLLPAYVPPPPAPLPDPSPDQQSAIDATEKHVHVVAGPGTGKTTTLIHRVKKLIETDRVDPRKILVLTFTNKAAAELVDRLQRAKVTGASEIWAGTFHAFGLEFIRKYYQHFGVTQDVAVADKITQITLTAKALAASNLQFYRRTDDPYEWLPDVIKVALRIKEEMVSPDHYLEESLKVASGDTEKSQYQDVATVAKAYNEALQRAGMVDFVDLVASPALAIENDRAKFAEIADRYQHILVDEFQDLTSAMMALVTQLSLNSRSLWVVGDVRQAIYHWRGASLDALLSFEERFTKAKRYDLIMNRRSVQEVIDLTAAVGTHHPLQKNFPLPTPKCHRGSSERVATLLKSDKRPSMWKALTDVIRSDLANGIPYSQQVVIARKGSSVTHSANALKEAGIPTLYLGEILERPEIKDILAVIQLVVERSPRALIRVGELATPPMTQDDVKQTISAVSKDGSLQRVGWLKSNELKLSPQGHASRLDIAKKLNGFAWSTSPWDFLCELLLERRFLLADLADETIDGHLRLLAQWQFAYMARAGDGDRKRSTLFRLLNRLRLRQQIQDVYIDRELPPETNGLEGVRVMTVHASKGLEFQAVHLVNVNGADFSGADNRESLLPPEAIKSTRSRHNHESDVEAHNLLYVAVSRAKDALTIYEANQEYLFQEVEALESATQQKVLATRTTTPVTITASLPATSPKAIVAKAVSHEEFLAYDRCPRQFLYRFGMEMGQELSPNPSLQARGLVKRTLKVVSHSGRYAQLERIFKTDWEKARLPEKEADPQLWSQAWVAAENGAKFLSAAKGQFIESSVDVRGLSVGLPWGVAVKAPGGIRIYCVDFYSGSAHTLERQDKFLGQLMSLTTTSECIAEARLFDLNRKTERDVKPTKVYDRSIVATRSAGLQSGNFQPDASGYPCARCAYSYVCPSLLTA